jgi:hypothetical protein
VRCHGVLLGGVHAISIVWRDFVLNRPECSVLVRRWYTGLIGCGHAVLARRRIPVLVGRRHIVIARRRDAILLGRWCVISLVTLVPSLSKGVLLRIVLPLWRSIAPTGVVSRRINRHMWPVLDLELGRDRLLESRDSYSITVPRLQLIWGRRGFFVLDSLSWLFMLALYMLLRSIRALQFQRL